MIRSMTGFARAEQTAEFGRLAWEIRSVNHRYLDLSFRMPEDFRALENDLRQLASKHLRRGKVEAGLRFQAAGAGVGGFSIDAERLQTLRQAMDELGHAIGPTTAPDPIRVLAWPGVVRQESPDQAPLLAAARAVFEQAVQQLDENRQREGSQLRDFMDERIAILETGVARVRERYPQVRDGWLEKLRERCRDLGADVDPGRLEQEAVIAAQRLDVEEELARLSGHLQEVRKVLQRKDAVGRRLDFLMQELNREANTLSSKSQDGEMTREAVEMKVAIEQMREQVQNIE